MIEKKAKKRVEQWVGSTGLMKAEEVLRSGSTNVIKLRERARISWATGSSGFREVRVVGGQKKGLRRVGKGQSHRDLGWPHRVPCSPCWARGEGPYPNFF